MNTPSDEPQREPVEDAHSDAVGSTDDRHSPKRSPRQYRLPWITLTGLALLWVWVFPFSLSLNNPNERTRVLQARALVERGELHIGETYEDERGRILFRSLYGSIHRRSFVNDVALVCEDPDLEPPGCVGLLYPAKAPGSALLGVPGLWLATQLDLVPEGYEGEIRATWVLRLFGISIPTLLALVALAWLLREANVRRSTSRKVLWATGLGTGVFLYGTCFVGHALAGGMLVMGMAALVRATRGRFSVVWAALGGLLSAYAVLLEYHAVVAVMCVAVFTLVSSKRLRLLPGFAVGSLASLGIHVLTHTQMFGSALKTGHLFLVTAHNRAGQSAGFMGIEGVTFGSLRDHLLDPYMGLIPSMPWIFFASVAGVLALRQRGQSNEPNTDRPANLGRLPGGAHWVFVAIPAVYLLFISALGNWHTMNGWGLGPRYLTPALLPMAFLAGVGWDWVARKQGTAGGVLSGLAVASVAIVVAVTVSFPSPPETPNAFADFALPVLAEGFAVRNLGMSFGLEGYSMWPFWGALLAVGLVLIWPGRLGIKGTVSTILVAVVVAMSWLAVMRSSTPWDLNRQHSHVTHFLQTWEGNTPYGEATFFGPPTSPFDHPNWQQSFRERYDLSE